MGGGRFFGYGFEERVSVSIVGKQVVRHKWKVRKGCRYHQNVRGEALEFG